MTVITSINPSTNQPIASYDLHSNEEIDATINKAQDRFENYRRTAISERALLMNNVAVLLEERAQTLGKMMTQEMGKTLKSAVAEVHKCAWVCRYYADHAETFLEDEQVQTDASKSYISYQPLGVVLAVMPWNYPFWQVFRFAAPALMAGNVALLKHASNVPGCAIAIQQIFLDAGFAPSTFTTLLIKSSQVSELLAHPKVMAATLTGSEAAGAAVAARAGALIKKTVLELGGSDPYIVLHDADLKHAAKQCAESRLLNAGQSCIGAKRFIVVKDVYDEFVALFAKEMQSAKVGDPMDEATTMGPLARHDLRDEVHQQVVESLTGGANLLLGGYIPQEDGAFYPPTILENVCRGMPAYDDEIFGPVASLIKVDDEPEAIRVANDTAFGLGSCVFTQDVDRGERIAREEIQAGCCFVNQYTKSDPRLPFGGIKQSGYGRELSKNGMYEFVNIKTVYIQ